MTALSACDCGSALLPAADDAGSSGADSALVDATADAAAIDAAGLDATALDSAADAGTAAACTQLPAADQEGLVQTSQATLRGRRQDEGWAFLGVRYAAPPLGERRFARPAPPACEAEIVDATEVGSLCPQLGASMDVVGGDEDCLFLNVYVPARQDDAPLPVLLFIHGGANIMGGSPEPVAMGAIETGAYDGTAVARDGDAVVVSFNYRLGALGFLAHPALDEAGGGAGNWAVHDWIAALTWVRGNIAAFGGDPGRVTVFGESAGGLAVCTLLASPLARGLFHGAIMQSGGCDAPGRDHRATEATALAEDVGCDGADDVATCLRQVPAEELVRAPMPMATSTHTWWLPYGPTVDGVTLLDTPIAVVERGEHNAVPLIVGSNANETTLFYAGPSPITCLDLEVMYGVAYPDLRQEVSEVYPCSRGLVVHSTFIAATTDSQFTCQARRLARAARLNQSEPVYRYHFRDGADWGVFVTMGAFHAWELFYLFDSFDGMLYLPSAGETALGLYMRESWGRFAASADPDASAEDLWPAYEVAEDPVITLDETPLGGMIIGSDQGLVPECDFWDQHVPSP